VIPLDIKGGHMSAGDEYKPYPWKWNRVFLFTGEIVIQETILKAYGMLKVVMRR
jgi:hypothetical protein